MRERINRADGCTVVLVGVGNIGSHAADHIARMPFVRELILVDPDHFESKNLSGQRADRVDVGRAKASAMARRLRKIRGDMSVIPIIDEVQNLPLGRLRTADVIVAGLDSRAARGWLSDAAWRLGVPLVDAGVDPSACLARVDVYIPGADAPCLRCGWTAEDWHAVEQDHPCPGGAGEVAPTNAPASLGGLAGALLAGECEKLLRGGDGLVLAGRELLVDARWHRHFVSGLRRNPQCRFDHQEWSVEPIGAASSLEDLLGRIDARPHGDLRLSVPGRVIARRRTCAGCGRTRRALSVHTVRGTLPGSFRPCRRCGGKWFATALDLYDGVVANELSTSERRRPLRRIGLRRGDVIAVESRHGMHHFVLDSSPHVPLRERADSGGTGRSRTSDCGLRIADGALPDLRASHTAGKDTFHGSHS